MNNPIRFVDPKGGDVLDEIKYYFSGKEWRDDTENENIQQKDLKNLTPHLQKKPEFQKIE